MYNLNSLCFVSICVIFVWNATTTQSEVLVYFIYDPKLKLRLGVFNNYSTILQDQNNILQSHGPQDLILAM